MSDIKTINADEAYQMVKENKCNLIDIRELNELELTGKVEEANHIPTVSYTHLTLPTILLV